MRSGRSWGRPVPTGGRKRPPRPSPIPLRLIRHQLPLVLKPQRFRSEAGGSPGCAHGGGGSTTVEIGGPGISSGPLGIQEGERPGSRVPSHFWDAAMENIPRPSSEFSPKPRQHIPRFWRDFGSGSHSSPPSVRSSSNHTQGAFRSPTLVHPALPPLART